MPASIVWIRQDLRLQDNTAFDAAIRQGGAVVPIYIWAPGEEDEGVQVARQGGGFIIRWRVWMDRSAR